jgi:hypothetical protein
LYANGVVCQQQTCHPCARQPVSWLLHRVFMLLTLPRAPAGHICLLDLIAAPAPPRGAAAGRSFYAACVRTSRDNFSYSPVRPAQPLPAHALSPLDAPSDTTRRCLEGEWTTTKRGSQRTKLLLVDEANREPFGGIARDGGPDGR